MATTLTNQGSSTYQFEGSSETMTTTSNENQIVLENATGLSIVKSSSPDTFLAGEIITYTVQITNNTGQFLSGVRIIDNLANGNLAYVLGSANLTVGTLTYPVAPILTSPLTFTLQQLNVGQSMTLTYDAQVIFNLPSSVTSLTNTVQGIGYTSTGTISGFDNNTIQKKTNGDLNFSKSASTTSVFPREVFDYYLTFQNGTATSVETLSITDQLPANFVLTEVYVRVGNGETTQLHSGDYTLTGTNFLTVSSVLDSPITVPAGGVSVVTLRGYFA